MSCMSFFFFGGGKSDSNCSSPVRAFPLGTVTGARERSIEFQCEDSKIVRACPLGTVLERYL